MILQAISIEGFEWVIGAGLLFGLAFLFTTFTHRSLKAFLIYTTIFSGFIVWAELLPLWVLVVNVIVLAMILYYEILLKRSLE